ncbi:hypothetical protein [Sedimentibacter sp. MB31-C6]|uniref:hypothetical protein n=1 Tax=Sedimentibacter sp. MB31-C6 TaxID=3109366 RepID=UPI002DDD55A8|nr:hypothetical protein [Sedimentibacter sp. MB36-C1]WSI02920.1 hypothetical protein U8307_07635 [Sedimentibacter sp. MB36-C1]
MFRKIMVWFLIVCMLISNAVVFGKTAELELIITGTGVKEEVLISEKDWVKYTMVERTFSTNNSLGFHKIIKAKGYDFFELISDNLKLDKDYTVKFTCSDGFEFTKTINELKNSYYYSDFTLESKEVVMPMIARYTTVMADFPKNIFSPPVSWTDIDIIESDLDKDFPKLLFGQTDIDDMNMSKWGKKIIKVTVGDERVKVTSESPYKHIDRDGEPYNIDAITGATFTIEGPAVEGYRAVSLRQIEEDTEGQTLKTYCEKVDGKVLENSYEGINVKYLIDNYVKAKENAGNITFKDKSRQKILTVPISEAENYTVAYGINEVPLVFLDTEDGYIKEKHNDNGCFKLIYHQDENTAKEFSNVAYIYIEEKDAKNIYEHSYAPYDDTKYTDYELIIHGDALEKEVRYNVKDIEAMEDIHVTKEYSLSNSEYFWYYNTFKGVPLWDILLKAGVSPKIDENTKVRFIAADNYNFAPMTIKQIKDNSLYGYYEKSALDKGDGTFPGEYVDPLYTEFPVLVAYGFNGYPYVTRPNDEGFNPGIGNDGGPIRIIFGKTNYNDTNGSNQVQFAKEIIIGEGESIATETQGTGEGESTQTDVGENAWNHEQGIYEDYLDMPVLRVTGSQIKEPRTFTLRQIEALKDYAIRDVYTGDGIREMEGIVLWDLINEVVELKDDVDVPSIRVFSGQNYNQILRSNEQVINGVLNSQGQIKDIILAYAADGYPLVPNEGSIGYVNNNAYGPLRLIIEESKSMWVKWTDCIVVGTGDYEAPEMKDVKTDTFFSDIENHWAKRLLLQNQFRLKLLKGFPVIFLQELKR